MPRYRLRDLLVLMLVIAILLAVLLPMIQRVRDQARRISCSNNLKQIAIAIHNYHAAYKQLPAAMGGTAANRNRLSGLVALAPFVEHQQLWEDIANPLIVGGVSFPPMGPSPTDPNYPPWQAKIQIYDCPADARSDSATSAGFGQTNYALCIGDSASNIHPPKTKKQVRGMFSPRAVIKFRSVIDGLSNTVMATEIGTANERHKQGQFVVDASAATMSRPIDCLKTVDPNSPNFYLPARKLSLLGRGGVWADGAAGHALVNTILPPNSPSCGITITPSDGLFSAGSNHFGGCHVMMGDGAVLFMTNTVDAGDLTAAPPTTVLDADGESIESPYGVWGAMGTRAGTELIADVD